MGRARTILRCAAIAIALAQSSIARADGGGARAHFEAGEAAFAAHDYATAGTEFDAAYAASPHESALFNGALSWENAGDLARAANLYKLYLRVAPADAPDRDKAANAVAALSTRLGRIDIVRGDAGTVGVARDPRVDARSIDDASVFTTPGEHVLTWLAPDGTPKSRVVSVKAGESVSVVLVDTARPTPTDRPPVDGPSVKPVEPVTPPPRRGITPWVAVSLGGATTISGALLLWSGIDVLGAKSDFDRDRPGLSVDEQEARIEEGRAKTDRTNVLIGITGAFGIATAVTLAFTDFGSSRDEPAPAKVGARVGPGSVALVGTF